jgi:hypothetical protein
MKTTANIAASVRQRLLNYAKTKNRPFDETLRTYAMERFLFRLGQSRSAMVKLGEQNSRMKDFLDIWLLSQQFEFDGALLQKACRRTFLHRETPLEDTPVALTVGFVELPDKKRQWNAYLRRLSLDFTPPVYADVMATIRTFLLPLVAPIQSNKPFPCHWSPPVGPWLTKKPARTE